LRRGSDAPPLLLRAARQLEPIDASLSRDTYLEALFAAISVGRFGGEDGLPKMAEAASAAPAPTTPPQATDVLFDGLVVRFTEGYMAAAPLLKRAPAAFRRESATTGGDVRSLRLAIDLWDDDAWHERPPARSSLLATRAHSRSCRARSTHSPHSTCGLATSPPRRL
jgi:hypothetical protein